MPTGPPRNPPVQTKKLWWTAASMNVTRNRTATNGFFRSRMALSQARESAPDRAGLGGVCGSTRLNAARASEAIPATRKMYRWAVSASAPVLDVPRASPNQVTNPTSPRAGTFDQSTRMKMNGQLAAIHPIVPQTRTGPNWRDGSLRLAKAIELVIEIVGT